MLVVHVARAVRLQRQGPSGKGQDCILEGLEVGPLGLHCSSSVPKSPQNLGGQWLLQPKLGVPRETCDSER